MPRPLRFIEPVQITEAVSRLCVEANCRIGADILKALSKARDLETLPLAQSVLDMLLRNAEIADKENLPLCQDTGMAVVFADIGNEVHVIGDITEAINEGVRQGYREGYGRSSIVQDPVNRVNTGDNTPAVIYYDFIPGQHIRLTVAPKGFGSENMSGVRLLTPADGIEGIEDFVVETVRKAGANPCPPIIVGVGVGGTMDKAALLAKKALLRAIDSTHPDPFWAQVEVRLLERINALNIGPAGFGGRTTALGINILTYPTHIAGLPMAVNIGCHVTRHKSLIL